MENIKRYSGILVKHNDKVLLCKRNNQGSLPGVWSIPAGKLNHNESPYDGALREFYEETNIKPDSKIKLVGFINRTKRDGKKNKGLMYVFLMEVNEKINPDLENAIDGDEHSECGYFDIENIPIEDKNDQLYKIITKILSKN
jgi:ADP-ribose pyrophosphatase YjhB (NUDIX family)